MSSVVDCPEKELSLEKALSKEVHREGDIVQDECIKIVGAKVHNLKNVSASIPRNKFVVITGLSGSGKSSLAFDTLYAEGQRRYMDTLSGYAKYFMGSLEKPDVESITGLSPIIAIEQKSTGNNPRSTVGTITETFDFLRLLYAKISKAYSIKSGKELIRYNDQQLQKLIIEKYKGKKCLLLAPLVKGRKGHYQELLARMRKKGYNEMLIDNKLEELKNITSLDRYKQHFLEVVVDKLIPKEEDEKRIGDSISIALGLGSGEISIFDIEKKEIQYYSKHFVDPDSGISIKEPAPHSFSFNSPQGYCPHCKGLGETVNIDINNIIPNKKISIADGGIVPLGEVRETKQFEIIRAIAKKYDFSIYTPLEELSEEIISLLIYGSDELFRIGNNLNGEVLSYPGIVQNIEDKITCPYCKGSRLSKESNYFKIDNKSISEVAAMEISKLREWVDTLNDKLPKRDRLIARDIIKELQERLGFMIEVGLDYLSLDRATNSLSGGESQRIRLATQIGSKLVNVLYILDEPSIGLHQRDNRKLISSLKKLRDEGNSVMVVEHDAETMLAADWLIDVGPKAGKEGGEICINAPLNMLLKYKKKINVSRSQERISQSKETIRANKEGIQAAYIISDKSTTLQYLNGSKKIDTPKIRRKGNGHFIEIKNARGNNLKEVSLSIPLGMLVGICGVSGSGKSSLINDSLVPYIKNSLYNSNLKILPFDSIKGIEHINKLIEIDQSAIGRNPKSNPATFTGVFDDIRKLFAESYDAKVRGYDARRFSFNVKGGRCEECKGAGIKLIEMNFLPAAKVVCEQCRGKRYSDSTLEVKYKNKTINDVLNMPISEALDFFEHIPRIAQKLNALSDVGLGYVHLGQSAITLSGGERQRMKLAAELCKKPSGNTLYIFDEPTTGLHFEDIKILMEVIQKLVNQGNSAIIIEHNLDVLKSVDYIFDLGPEGGKKGGYIVAQGTPEEIANDNFSVTGPFLKEIL